MMKRRYRLLIPAVAPLLLKSGYLLEAWRHSPLDRWDWCFFLLAGILTAAGWKRIRNWAGRPDWRGLWFLLPAVAVWGAGIVKQVNAVQTGGALLILFSSLFVLGGVRLFSGMLSSGTAKHSGAMAVCSGIPMWIFPRHHSVMPPAEVHVRQSVLNITGVSAETSQSGRSLHWLLISAAECS